MRLFRTTASSLLVLAAVVAVQSARAQSGPATPSDNQKNSKYTLFFDFKEVWLAVNAHGVLNDGTPVKARITLNPSMFWVGVKFHFPFGRGH